MFVSLQGFHLFVLQGEHFAKFLGHCRLILMGYATKYLSLDMCHAELGSLRKGSTDGILYALQRIGNDKVNPFDTPFLQRLKLLFPAYDPFRGMIHYGEHLPASVLQYTQHGIVSILAYLPVPAGGDEGGVNVDGQVMRGQGTAEPQLNVLTATPGQIGNLLPAVSAAIDAVGDLTYLLRSKSLGVEKVEQPRTFLALIAYQAQENGIEVAAAGDV